MRCFSKNDGDYMFLSSDSSDTLFLFVHGYGSSPLDLLPLAKEIHKKNNNCALLLLKGHGESEKELSKYRYKDWKQQVIEAVNYYKKFKKIYIIGFSLGATISIYTAGTLKNKKIKGVIGIGTFTQPTNKVLHKILDLSSFFKIKKFPRFPQVTNKITKKEIIYSKYLPAEETKIMVDEVKKRDNIFTDIECNTFLLHSIDDKVADYYSVSNLANNNTNIKLITFRNLNHFMQFDMPQQILSETILELLEPRKNDKINNDMIKDLYNNMSAELNHWSGIIYKLIAGFFSVFGALVYFSLPDILAKKSTTPYYLTTYALLTCIFVILATMYFFYVNRTNVFLKLYVEPYLNVMPWATYRTNKFLSGSESVKVTRKVAIVVIGLPMTIATGSLIYVIYGYMAKYIFDPTNNILLIVSFIITLILYYGSFSILKTLQKYTTRELYNLSPQKFDNTEQLNMIIKLYNSVNTGCVKQKCTTVK